MDVLTAAIIVLITISILFEVANRVGVPYPSLFVLGGLVLGFIPGLPRISLEPDLVLLVFLPPLLFTAATELPQRELRRYRGPISRLAVGLVVFTIIIVGVVAHAADPALGWGGAFALGAIVAPTDALAATTVFQRLGAPRVVTSLVESEALLNDATALVAYRAAVAAVLSGAFILSDALVAFAVSAAGGVLVGLVVGLLAVELLRRLDDPPVEVVVGLVIPFAAYLPADRLGVSGVLAAVIAGLVIGRRLGTILTPRSRVMWLTTWKMVAFVLNGFVFVLIGTELPTILAAVQPGQGTELVGLILLIVATIVVTRFVWVFAVSLLPGSARRVVARIDPSLARRLTFLVSWAGLRGAVSLAAALALPTTFPERNTVLLITFAVILVTLVGQGLSLPAMVRWSLRGAPEIDGDEPTLARNAAYEAGLAEIERVRPDWPTHQPLLDRLESGLQDRTRHLATEDPDETAERAQEREEHEEIQRGVIEAERMAVAELRDRGEINDQTLRLIERELDLEEIRMEG